MINYTKTTWRGWDILVITSHLEEVLAEIGDDAGNYLIVHKVSRHKWDGYNYKQKVSILLEESGWRNAARKLKQWYLREEALKKLQP